jgi:hypothetical protein
MSAINTTSFANALKILYPNTLAELWLPESPAAAWLPKKTDFVGKHWEITPITSGVNGSHTFATALSGKSAPVLKTFQVTRRASYVLVSVDAQTVQASKGQVGALREAIDVAMRSSMYEHGRSIGAELWGNGGGARGRIAAGGISGAVITLTSVADANKFEEGMVIQLSTADGTSGAVKVGECTILRVNADPTTATLTCTANVTAGIPTAAAADYIFRKGDFGLSLKGFFSWIPATAPTGGDSHFGVDRSANVVRLAGNRINGGGASYEDTTFSAMAHVRRAGGRPDSLFVNPIDMAVILKSVYSKTWIDVQTDVPNIGYRALAFPTAGGVVKVIEDPDCGAGVGLLTRRDSWLLRSLGDLPHFADEDGLKWRTEGSADAVEARLRSWAQLGCLDPRHSCHITW